MQPNSAADHLAWLDSFSKEKGRPLRVLHVGNIANNAYLVAKFQRRVGIEADVLCHDYYHIMATPEWEELSLRTSWGDDYRPKIAASDLGNYKRPSWFVQGPLRLCLTYIAAMRSGDAKRSNPVGSVLERFNRGEAVGHRQITNASRITHTINWRRDEPFHLKLKALAVYLMGVALQTPYLVLRPVWQAMLYALRRLGLNKTAAALIQLPGRRGHLGYMLRGLMMAKYQFDADKVMSRVNDLTGEFKATFPDRPDAFVVSDVAHYANSISVLETIFQGYDIVQGYGLDPILPMLAGKNPYVAFEHGTLRDFIREDRPVHRLTALAYRKAAHVFVTNGDCLEHAKWLGLEHATAMLHPVDVDQHETRNEAKISALRAKYDADVLLISPIRHDWAVKGVDVHIRALPLLRERIPGKIKLLLAPWGQQIEDSRKLIKSLGCEDSVIWLERPLCRIDLIDHMQAADVVLDQMTLPHFGATAPQALAAGSPVVMSYRPESTSWIVDEPAPILAALSPEEVVAAVVTAIDPKWRKEFKIRAHDWVHNHHHHDRIVRDHLEAYRRILGDQQNADRRPNAEAAV